jgi:hypothetical protein
VFTLAKPPLNLHVKAAAALKVAGPKARLCGCTALELAGVPVLRSAPEVEIWVPAKTCGTQRTGIKVRRNRLLRPTTDVGGLPSISLMECWLHLAEHASLEELVVVADGLTRRQKPFTFTEDLAELLAEPGRRTGIQLARQALELTESGTDSPMETLLRLRLVNAGLPTPVVNYPIPWPDGGVRYWLDMAYPDHLVGVEYDGSVHVHDFAQMRSDITRRRNLEDLGWRIITGTSRDIAKPDKFIRSVRQALTRPPELT